MAIILNAIEIRIGLFVVNYKTIAFLWHLITLNFDLYLAYIIG